VLGYTKKGRAVTFEELARNGLTADLPEDGREVVKVLTFDFKEDKLFVLDRQSAVPLARLKLTVAYRALEAAPSAPPVDKPLDPEDDDYTQDVFVKRKEA
jgi:glucose dehydrogenase